MAVLKLVNLDSTDKGHGLKPLSYLLYDGEWNCEKAKCYCWTELKMIQNMRKCDPLNLTQKY